ncbi:MAG: DipZ protein [Solirubrobacterales bacterium]
MSWIGAEPGSMAELTAAGPALVHFFDFAQLNSVRTLPYLREWDSRYAGLGLAVIGVQSPRFPFGAEEKAVRGGLKRLGLGFPVAIDAGRTLWIDYGCEGWPSLFLWGQGGALRWFQFGEGDYLGTELAIQEELLTVDALRPMPEPMAPLRPTDAPGARVIAPTPELIPAEGRPWTVEDGTGFGVNYEAAGAWATLEGQGGLRVGLDRGSPREVAVEGAGLYPLARHPDHGAHHLEIEIDPGIAVWAIGFEPGLAPPDHG